MADITFVAIVRLELNGTTYESGDTIDNADLPSGSIRSMVRKGMIDAIDVGT